MRFLVNEKDDLVLSQLAKQVNTGMQSLYNESIPLLKRLDEIKISQDQLRADFRAKYKKRLIENFIKDKSHFNEAKDELRFDGFSGDFYIDENSKRQMPELPAMGPSTGEIGDVVGDSK